MRFSRSPFGSEAAWPRGDALHQRGAGQQARDLRVVMRQDAPEVDISPVYRFIEADPHLRHPSPGTLEERYDKGMAAVLLETGTGEAKAYVSVFERSSRDLRSALRLPDDIPSIWEYGSLVVLTEFQGRGYSTALSNKLMQSFAESVNNGRVAVIGITNNWQVIRTAQHGLKVGVEFDFDTIPGYHVRYPMMTQFFCNCEGVGSGNFMLRIPGCGESEVPHSQLEKYDPATGSMDHYTVFWTHPEVHHHAEAAMTEHVSRYVKMGGEKPEAAIRRVFQQEGYYDV